MKNPGWMATTVGLLLMLGLGGHAKEDIEFYNGPKLEGATVVKIQNGFLYFEHEGAKRKIELLRVKSIAKVEEIDDYCTITRFEDAGSGRRRGRILSLAVKEERGRMQEPLVRVFALVQGKTGEREMRLYRNHRVTDPTSTNKLPTINSRAYRDKSFLIPLAKAAAWRVEAWFDGQLRLEYQDSVSNNIRDGWWRSYKLERTAVFEEPRDEHVVAADEPEEDARSAVPPVEIKFAEARFTEDLERKRLLFEVGLRLESRELEEVRLPETNFYYVTENNRKQRSVRSHRFRARRVQLANGRYHHTDEFALPKNVTTGAKAFEFDKDDDLEKLVFWRIELTYDDEVVGVRESNNQKAKESLPANWWEM